MHSCKTFAGSYIFFLNSASHEESNKPDDTATRARSHIRDSASIELVRLNAVGKLCGRSFSCVVAKWVFRRLWDIS